LTHPDKSLAPDTTEAFQSECTSTGQGRKSVITNRCVRNFGGVSSSWPPR
jgi:hypothetical protein